MPYVEFYYQSIVNIFLAEGFSGLAGGGKYKYGELMKI
jgi:hypothetical protein